MAIDSEILIFKSDDEPEEWRVEYFDEDGGCYVVIFAGPAAERRAREYVAALKAGTVGQATAMATNA